MLIETGFEGLKVVQTKIFHDNRGFFVERFNADVFAKLGLPTQYFQDNHSLSYPKVIRGLHYQQNPAQAKLVGCVRGAIWDVAVDIRKNSKTFGKYFAIELSAQNGKLMFIPEGFAHGFCVLGNEPADVFYKVNASYNKQGEGGIGFDDEDLAINWPIKEGAIVSQKDLELPSFASYKENVVF